MARSNRVSWETVLRKSIRSHYDHGWAVVIVGNSGRTKYPNDGENSSKTLSIVWRHTNGLQLLKAIEFIK